ncbi:MAG: hypothetical protein KDC24_13375, partial [Saprospiraceae bacterium]|nr:hypothetical protein [Saprospiraceae bacterium]
MNRLLVLAVVVFSITACGKEEPIIDTTPDFTNLLNNLGNDVILATYQDLSIKGASLQTAAANLEADPSPENLEAARRAWVAARSPWEQSEGFLFGPVDQEGLDPSLDSWPVNVTDLNNVLNSNNELTVSFLEQQEGTLKGFHTIEFLLWGEDGNKTVDQLSAREFEYLAACAGALANDTEALYNLWAPASGNYIENIVKAGNGSPVYISQKSAVEEITNALVIIADEVANGKINEPLSQMDLSLEESRFSSNSKADFADNMRSIQNIYVGNFGVRGNGIGLSIVVANENPTLDSKVKNQI